MLQTKLKGLALPVVMRSAVGGSVPTRERGCRT